MICSEIICTQEKNLSCHKNDKNIVNLQGKLIFCEVEEKRPKFPPKSKKLSLHTVLKKS